MRPSVIDRVADMQAVADRLRAEGRRLAVVPTMGALHEGHLTLIRRAKAPGAVVIVSVFVNPMQFGPAEDFDRYPRDLAGDVERASTAGADIVFAPAREEMYPPGYRTFVEVEKVTEGLEGRSRPGHFRGVATVVTKLFLCTKPHVAYVGQKDAQQAVVIRQLVRDLNLDIDIVVVPTVREPDGLALSSRNVYLSPSERSQATILYRALREAEALIRDGERSADAVRNALDVTIRTQPDARVDYLSVADASTLEELHSLRQGGSVLLAVAVRFGKTRLIDNLVAVV